MPFDPETVPDKVKQFVIAVRRLSSQDGIYVTPTRKSIQKLILTIEEHLQDKKMRVLVIRAITGLPITSTNQLTQWTVSTLIEEVTNVSRDHEDPIAYTERLLTGEIACQAFEVYPWERPQASMPNVREGDLW